MIISCHALESGVRDRDYDSYAFPGFQMFTNSLLFLGFKIIFGLITFLFRGSIGKWFI